MTSVENPSPSAPLAVGHLLADRFRVEAILGVGGMSTVYRATDEALGRTVALKVFRSDLADADDVRRQRDEVQLLASLSAPGLVTLFDAVAEGSEGHHGRAFLVLEFVDGIDLRTRLLEGVPDVTLVGRIGSDVASALSFIHSRGVVHRDVKPGNILLPHDHPTPDAPRAKLADFGIARLLDDAGMTTTGTVIGTAVYLSPEQAMGATVGTASDVYSLGLVLLESLTGARAFPGTAVEAAVSRLARDPEIPATLSDPWRGLLASMTRRDPLDRPEAAAVAAMLAGPAFRSTGTDGLQEDGLQEDGRQQPEPTLLMPIGLLAAEDSTRPFSTGSAERTTVLSPPTAPPVGVTPAGRRRRLAVFGATAAATAAAIVIVFVIALALSRSNALSQSNGTGPPSSPSAPAPQPSVSNISYPNVSGTLGEHLRQLQQSVAP